MWPPSRQRRIEPRKPSTTHEPKPDPEQWFNLRRPQILPPFANLLYGVVPTPEAPIRTTFKVMRTNREFMGGQVIRKDVRIRFENAKGTAELPILVFTPRAAQGPVPAFLLHSFAGTKDGGHDADPDKPGFLRNGIPLGEFIKRGFGFVVVPQDALARHNEVEFLKGIHPLFYRSGQSFPKANEWGVIDAVAWGASRAMDCLETDQHMLLVCIAPRPLYVASAAEDFWANPRGEYLSAYHASEVYRLLGKKGLEAEASPTVGEAIITSEVGYHNRPGGHSVEMFDWLKFMEFAEYHLRPKNREAN